MPRPNIIGKPIRRIDMHHSSPGKNKDYRVTISEEGTGKYRVYTEHGPAGKLNQGKEQTTSSVSLGSALNLANQLRDAKINQTDSYHVVTDTNLATPTQAARAPRPTMSADDLSDVCKVRLAAMF